MKTLFLNKLIAFCLYSLLGFHPVHFSVTNIDIHPDEQTVNLSIKVFKSDLEYAIIHRYDKLISLSDSMTSETSDLLKAYISSSFMLSLLKKPLSLNLKDIQFQDDSMWLFYTCQFNGTGASSIKLTNKILLDLYPDQTNLVIVNLNNEEKGYSFNYKTQETEIKIQ